MSSQYSWGKEQALREQIVRVGRLMYERELVVAADGNISARLDEAHVLCTPSGLCKGLMTPEQLIVVDMQGNKVGPGTDANRNLKPTSEIFMHLEAFRQRPDIGGVVHAHPPTTVALSIAGVSLADCMLPEVIVNLGLVPTTQYATPASAENVDAIRNLISSHDGMILQRHGTLTVGRDAWEAYMRLESLEQVARISLILQQLGRGEPLPPAQVEKLLAQRQKMGLARPGEEEEFCQVCGVCHLDGQHIHPLPEADSEADLIRAITQAVLRELGQAG
ncbi:MAG: class II aldolase/adducin family protein [Anaerolineales bacterium]|nr:MAG: class II aldolase/adducin family protein [Anaerolineales bacterium]